jgi:hypothetical protein
MKLTNFFVAASALIIGSFLFASASHAQLAALNMSGKKAQYDPANFTYEGGGTGTHVGRHHVGGKIEIVSVDPPRPGVFFSGEFAGDGLQSHVAANKKDVLYVKIVKGRVELLLNEQGLVFGTWTASAEIQGGKGRFADASGDEVVVKAINPPFDPAKVETWPFDWFVKGRIDLGKRRK